MPKEGGDGEEATDFTPHGGAARRGLSPADDIVLPVLNHLRGGKNVPKAWKRLCVCSYRQYWWLQVQTRDAAAYAYCSRGAFLIISRRLLE
jgi:hypothetical protein